MPKRPPPDYLTLEQEAWRENTKEVSNRLSRNEPNLLNGSNCMFGGLDIRRMTFVVKFMMTKCLRHTLL